LACTTVLGIDGNYTSISEAPPGAGGRSGSLDAMAAGRPPDQKPASGSGGATTTGSGGYPNELPPAPFDSAGGSPSHHADPDAGQRCPTGQKWCEGACVPKDPLHGCATPECGPCKVADPNAHAICDEIGVCVVMCNAGLVPNANQCERRPDAGAGGAPAAGGATGDGGKGAGGFTGDGGQSTGSGGRPAICNPLACPNCSRGFEGCCVPALPGKPAHCGCFYVPPLCTDDVGGI
jgi:hypothetical protein